MVTIVIQKESEPDDAAALRGWGVRRSGAPGAAERGALGLYLAHTFRDLALPTSRCCEA